MDQTDGRADRTEWTKWIGSDEPDGWAGRHDPMDLTDGRADIFMSEAGHPKAMELLLKSLMSVCVPLKQERKRNREAKRSH